VKSDRRKTGRATVDSTDIGLEDLLGAFGAALSEMIGRLDPGSAGEVRRDFQVDTDRGPVRAQAGLRVRVGGLDAARNSRRDATSPLAAAPRPSSAPRSPSPPRPISAEVVDDGVLWTLTAELPGAALDDLELVVEDDVLVITATTSARRYADRIELPPGTSRETLRVSLQNGILEIEAPSQGATRA
jgi:HSP20 family molecular chaperone IbpA